MNLHKFCKDCLVELNEHNTNAYDLKSSQYVCKLCRKSRDKRKYEKRRELIREKQRIYDLNIKMKVIKKYGGKCYCCDEATIEFLTINYVGNNQERNDKTINGKLYRSLIKDDLLNESYQLLCYNCNYSKQFLGYCPHNNYTLAGLNA